MEVFSKLFKWVMSLLTKLWKLVKKIAPIVLLGLALVCAFAGEWPLAVLFAGASLLLFPKETAEVATKAVKAVGAVASTAAEAIGSAVGTGVSSLASASGFIGMVALGFFLWLFLNRKKSADEPDGKEEGPEVPRDAPRLQGSYTS